MYIILCNVHVLNFLLSCCLKCFWGVIAISLKMEDSIGVELYLFSKSITYLSNLFVTYFVPKATNLIFKFAISTICIQLTD